MSIEEPKQDLPKRRSSGMWKFWLAVALFVAFSVGRHMEENSPEGKAQTAQLYQNAVRNAYTETLDDCEGKLNSDECRQQAANAAQLARRQLGPALGQ